MENLIPSYVFLFFTINLSSNILFVQSDSIDFPLNFCGDQNTHDRIEILSKNFTLSNDLLPKRLVKESPTLRYRPVENEPDCENGWFMVEWSRTRANYSPLYKTEDEAPPQSIIKLSPHNYLNYENQIYGKNSYCLDGLESSDKLSFKICNESCSASTPCIPKCCQPEDVFDVSQFDQDGSIKCRPSGSKVWKPVLYADRQNKLSLEDSVNIRPILKMHGPNEFCTYDTAMIISSLRPIGTQKRTISRDLWFPRTWYLQLKIKVDYKLQFANIMLKSHPMEYRYRCTKHVRVRFRLLSNGSILEFRERYVWTLMTEGKFCIDGAQNYSGNSTLYTGDELDTVVVFCHPLPTEESTKTSQRLKNVSIIYSVTFILCSVVLLITIFVHVLLWEKQNVHSWAILGYITSLLFTYLLLSATHITSITLVIEQNEGPWHICRIIGILVHFAFLSSFTWLSVINFDVWRTFRVLKPSGNSKGLKRFIAYAIFAIGIPTIIVTVAVTIDNIYRDETQSDVIVPGYGIKTCYLELVYAQLPYFYLPVSVLMTANIVFFVLTVYSLYSIQKATKFATSSSSKNEKQRQSAQIFAKIFFIAGIPWTFEFISYICTSSDPGSVPWYWNVIDIIEICQAFAIFAIFVLKKETCRSLDAKYPKFKNFKQQFLLSPERKELLKQSHPILYAFLRFCPICLSGDSDDPRTQSTTATSNLASNITSAPQSKLTLESVVAPQEAIEMKITSQ